jgi:hypothetical protein
VLQAVVSVRLEQGSGVPEQVPEPGDQLHPLSAVQVVVSVLLKHEGAVPEQVPEPNDQRHPMSAVQVVVSRWLEHGATVPEQVPKPDDQMHPLVMRQVSLVVAAEHSVGVPVQEDGSVQMQPGCAAHNVEIPLWELQGNTLPEHEAGVGDQVQPGLAEQVAES